MKVLVALGTRPEIVKLAPVLAALERARFDVHTVATGQHDDPLLADAFFEALGVEPDTRGRAAGATDGDRLASILALAYKCLAQVRPDLVLVLGDTYTVPLFCLAARHHGVPVAHIEAGMRSFNETSMEEVNRRIGAATASLHLVPTATEAAFLSAEGVPDERVHVVGNPVIDAIVQRGVDPTPVSRRRGLVVTVHRRATVDDPDRLTRVVDLLQRLAGAFDPVVFPVHPRTRSRLERIGALAALADRGVRTVDPLPYDEMLRLVSSSRVVVTDSGGLQEEAAWFGVPTVVLRASTPRWAGVRSGSAVLCGLDPELAIATITRLASPREQTRIAGIPCPYGDGHAADRIAGLLLDPGIVKLLRLSEPDFVGRAVPA